MNENTESEGSVHEDRETPITIIIGRIAELVSALAQVVPVEEEDAE